MLLLFARPPRVIAAGYAVISLSGIGAEVDVRIIRAGVAIIRLAPETSVFTAPVVAPAAAVAATAAELLAAAVITSHRPIARLVTLTADGSARTTFDPDRIILSGSVSFDRRREVSRTASLELADVTGLSPISYADELAQGQRIRLERGARVGGLDIFALLGVFEITSYDAAMAGTLSLSAEDPSTALQQPLGEPFTIPANTSGRAAVRMLWEPVLGDGSAWDLDDDAMGLSEARTIAEDEERLHAAIGLVSDLGLELWMGRDGLPVMRARADPNTLPISRTYRQVAGEALAADIRRSGDRRPYNRQVVIGESPTGQVYRAVADITDRTSPIHQLNIGLRVAPIYRSAGITTQHQADMVARARLIEGAMWSDTLIWVGAPDPTLEAGEVISFEDAQTRTGSRYHVESVSLPVTTGAMSIEGSRVLPLFELAA